MSSSDEDGAEESSHTQPNLAPTGSRQPLTDCLPNVVEPFGVKEHCANLENKILKDALPVLDTPVCIIHQSSKIDASVSYQEPIHNINKRLKPTRPVRHATPPASRFFEDEDLHTVSQTKLKENIDGAVCEQDNCSPKGCHRSQHEAATTSTAKNNCVLSAKLQKHLSKLHLK